MFIVYMQYVYNNQKDLCVVTKNREDAEQYIKKKMEGYVYSGLGVYKIDEIELYEGVK